MVLGVIGYFALPRLLCTDVPKRQKLSITHLHLSPRVWRLSLLGAHTGAAAICLAPGLEHPGIRDPRRSQGCKKGVSYCKHGGSGLSDNLCPPIQGEMKMLGFGERTPRHFDALCAREPRSQNGPLSPTLSPSEGERGIRRLVSGEPRFRGRAKRRMEQGRGSLWCSALRLVLGKSFCAPVWG